VQKERILTGVAGMVFLLLSLVMLPVAIQANYLQPAGKTVHTAQPFITVTPGSMAVRKSPGALSYAIKQGDTLSEIAGQYGVMVNDLVQANHLTNPDSLAAGEDLVIPVSAPVPGNPLAIGSSARTLPWPVTGPISSPFGEREIFGHQEFHTGIDIAGPLGTPIRVPLAGRVVFAGPLGAYGLAVIIDHGDGFNTLYAHASQLLVNPGQSVTAGQTIAQIGQTGDATGPHLHFETRVDGQPRDPMTFLMER